MDNLEHDLGEAKSFPDLDNVTNDTQGRHGLGQLGANLEFMPGPQLLACRIVSVDPAADASLQAGCSSWHSSKRLWSSSRQYTSVVVRILLRSVLNP